MRRIPGCRVFSQAASVFALALWVAGLAQGQMGVYVAPLSTTDVSPDAAPGEIDNQGSDPGGRVVSIVMNPRDQLTLYAASEMAGVWKSTNGGGRWAESNNGLRSPMSISHRHALALDDQNPDRLVYLTQDDDGRVGRPLGGLWVTTDGAANWNHVDLPLCPQPGLLDAVFTMGQAFVATGCGIATSSDPSLGTGTWTMITNLPFQPAQYAIAAIPNSRTLFACRGNQLYRSLSLGSPGSWTSTALLGGCLALAVTPDDDKKVIVLHLEQIIGRMQVSLFDMDLQGQQFVSVGPEMFPVACQGSFGSGNAAIYAVRRFDIPVGFGPGRSYEVFMADGCLFRKYELVGATLGQWRVIPNTHVDTFAMAFTPDYDPEFNRCTGYLTNDGGVFAHFTGCTMTGGWVRAMSGLHVMYSDTIGGASRPASQCGAAAPPCPTLYLPTGDNDVWVSDTGGLPNTNWKELGAALGDAATALIDPALPNTVLVARNATYKIAVSTDGKPPVAGATFVDIAPPNPSNGGAPPSLANLAQVMTQKGEAPLENGDYVAVESPGNGARDIIVRNTSGTADGWTDVSPGDNFSFGPSQVGAIGVSGGHQNPVIYVLTSPNADYTVTPVFYGPGEIWKGIAGGSILRWTNASRGVKTAYNIYVDPYDSNFAYITDLGDNKIKFTSDGGKTWQVDQDLTQLATNFGEFVFDCGNPGRASGPQRPSVLAWSCPLQNVVFDRDHPNIRVAALWFGGVVFSRDAGKHWIPLLVTNDDVFDNGPPEFPFSLFYDTQPNPQTGHPSLYVALLGKSMKRVDGPLLDVTASRVAICQICTGGLFGPRPKLVKLILDSPSGTILLKKDVRGMYRGTFLLDPNKTQTITYHFDLDGKQRRQFTHTISPQEQTNGVLPIKGDVTGSFFNRFFVWLHDLFDHDD